MLIKPLPQTLIRHIQCSTGLPDRFTIAKELIENAIDACLVCECTFEDNVNCSSRDKRLNEEKCSENAQNQIEKQKIVKKCIIIRITPYRISVTDTGCGISPSDLLTIGRKNWTSKIPIEFLENTRFTQENIHESALDVTISKKIIGQYRKINSNNKIGSKAMQSPNFAEVSNNMNTKNSSFNMNKLFANPICLGFRGEALSLIKDCSDVEIRSGKNGLAFSVQLKREMDTPWGQDRDDLSNDIQEGKLSDEDESNSKPSLQRIPYEEGTTVIVSNVFQNMTLKQRKMCKEYKKENERIRQMILGYAVNLTYEYCAGIQKDQTSQLTGLIMNKCKRCHTAISFSLYVNDQNICTTASTENLICLYNQDYRQSINFKSHEPQNTRNLENDQLLSDIAASFIKKQLVANFSVFTTPILRQKKLIHSSQHLVTPEKLDIAEETYDMPNSQDEASKIILLYSYSSRPVMILMVNGRYCRNRQIERIVQSANTTNTASGNTHSLLSQTSTFKNTKNNLLAHRRTIFIFITTPLADHNTEGKLDMFLADEIIKKIEKMLRIDGVKSLQRNCELHKKNILNKEAPNKEQPNKNTSIKIYKRETDLPQVFRLYGKNENKAKKMDENQKEIIAKVDQKFSVVGLYEDTLFLQQNDQLVACTLSNILVDYILKEYRSNYISLKGKKYQAKSPDKTDLDQKAPLTHISDDLADDPLFIVYDILLSCDMIPDSIGYEKKILQQGLNRHFSVGAMTKHCPLNKLEPISPHFRSSLVESFTTKNDLNDLFRFLLRKLVITEYITKVTDLKSIYRAVGR